MKVYFTAKKTAKITLVIFISLAIILSLSGCLKSNNNNNNNKNKKIKELETKLEKANKKNAELKKESTEKKTTENSNPKAETNTTGKYFGYIKSVYEKNGSTYLTVDYAEMLSGAAADAAAQSAGLINPGEHIENDYYIKNVNPKLRTFKISPSVTVSAQTYNMSGAGQVGDANITLATFKTIFKNKPSNQENIVRNPWWLTITGNKITKLKEQYLP